MTSASQLVLYIPPGDQLTVPWLFILINVFSSLSTEISLTLKQETTKISFRIMISLRYH